MKFSNTIFMFFTLVFSTAFGQENKSFDFKKGEVLDIILLSQSENSTKLYERYKKTAFPVAFEYSFQPQPSFRISKLTLGTNKPKAFIIGKWASLKKREGFLSNIVKRVPDFHQQRRDLFPYFGLTYYEVSKDLKFSIDTSKYNTVTAMWHKLNDLPFFRKWQTSVEKAEGKVIITLKNGISPTGYYYNPNVMCIVEWEDEAAFKAFSKKNPLDKYEALNNIHQFVIQ